jgi:antitoxin MazE
MKTQLSRWGNSLALRIPKSVAEAAKLQDGDTLDLDVEAPGSVRVRKPRSKPTLEELVAHIDDENRHGETDSGEPVGAEVW